MTIYLVEIYNDTVCIAAREDEKKRERSKGYRYQYGLLHFVMFATPITSNGRLGVFYEIVDDSEMKIDQTDLMLRKEPGA
jgi:hypothetical protein